MPKIVYLFGAGASANALPVVNAMPKRIQKMIDELPELDRKDTSGLPCDLKNLQVILDELKWLLEVIGNHATMDTLAKKLWIQPNKLDDYNRLRFAIATYFVLEQAYGKPDQRYDTFWASMVDGISWELPPNVSILSWNYDSQFEITYRSFWRSDDMSEIRLVLGIRQSVGIEDKFNILKLNGTALLSMNNSPINPFWGRAGMSVANYIHTLYIEERKSNSIYNPLSFTWSLDKANSLFPHIETRVKYAEILVVIGYSFPFFNRAIDRKIIESMPKLKKIYFQDPNPDDIANAFKAIMSTENMNAKGITTENIKYTAQFFLPPEL